MLDELTCRTCSKFERDPESKAGGWCPIPNKKDPFKQSNKYVFQSHNACKRYEKREREEK